MIENTLQNIIRKTGRKPTECKCQKCQSQCKIPCLGTPQDIVKIYQAGFSDKLALSHWLVGMLVGKLPGPIVMVQPIQTKNGCIFFKNGLCELHDLGLKPTEGRLSYHTLTAENFSFKKSLAWNVAKQWVAVKNLDIVHSLLIEYQTKQIHSTGTQLKSNLMND